MTDNWVHDGGVVFEDITERKARQAELEHESQKLEWIQRIVDALAEERFVLYAQPIIDLRTLAAGWHAKRIVDSHEYANRRDPPPG